jgi:hypothetical protein
MTKVRAREYLTPEEVACQAGSVISSLMQQSDPEPSTACWMLL